MKKVKSLLALLLVAVMVFALAGCGSSSSDVYIIASDTTFAPFEYTNEAGEFVGIDVDIINAIAEDQGFEIEIQSLGFNAALTAVQSGQADGVIAGCSITSERELIFDFSTPYYDSGVVMGISSSDSSIKSYDDLEGKIVAMKIGTEGTTFAESIQDEYGFTTITFDTSDAMYMAVTSGQADACFEDFAILGYGISTGNVAMQIVTDPEEGSPYGFAVNKGENAELLEMFNAGLANIIANGTYQAIIDSYIG
ncbi:MAG: transporter substrate-binding domain-containing protein [Bacillota bacterium]